MTFGTVLLSASTLHWLLANMHSKVTRAFLANGNGKGKSKEGKKHAAYHLPKHQIPNYGSCNSPSHPMPMPLRSSPTRTEAPPKHPTISNYKQISRSITETCGFKRPQNSQHHTAKQNATPAATHKRRQASEQTSSASVLEISMVRPYLQKGESLGSLEIKHGTFWACFLVKRFFL